MLVTYSALTKISTQLAEASVRVSVRVLGTNLGQLREYISSRPRLPLEYPLEYWVLILVN
jgi:hypothetical protein